MKLLRSKYTYTDEIVVTTVSLLDSISGLAEEDTVGETPGGGDGSLPGEDDEEEEDGKDEKEDFVKILKLSGIVPDKESLNCFFLLSHVPPPKKIGLGASKIKIRLEYRDTKLDEFEVVNMLGVGSFGKVELIRDKKCPENVFALKTLSKTNIVERSQQQHVFNEKKILIGLNSQFIIQLYKTFKDDRNVYLLMEVCLGGELWTILRDHGRFDELTSRFYIGCVVEALEYLHERDIAFRDLKPENLLMDTAGYVKLIDFGFAKKIFPGRKTMTFCGTPEYVAPEVLLDEGHDLSVDCWSLGILIYELQSGNPPFTGSTMEIYESIVRGFEDMKFSKHINKSTQRVIKKLCKEKPKERLGCQKNGITGIRKDRWFRGFKWKALQNKTMQAPLRPKINSYIDTSNFDECELSTDAPEEEFSGWDQYF